MKQKMEVRTIWETAVFWSLKFRQKTKLSKTVKLS